MEARCVNRACEYWKKDCGCGLFHPSQMTACVRRVAPSSANRTKTQKTRSDKHG